MNLFTFEKIQSDNIQSKHIWPVALVKEYKSIIDSKIKKLQHPITYVNRVFQGSQLNWAALTKENI